MISAKAWKVTRPGGRSARIGPRARWGGRRASRPRGQSGFPVATRRSLPAPTRARRGRADCAPSCPGFLGPSRAGRTRPRRPVPGSAPLRLRPAWRHGHSGSSASSASPVTLATLVSRAWGRDLTGEDCSPRAVSNLPQSDGRPDRRDWCDWRDLVDPFGGAAGPPPPRTCPRACRNDQPLEARRMPQIIITARDNTG
jgi:hypothetical protein